MNKENPVVGKDYNKLVEAMNQCAERDNLPQMLQINDITNVSLKDVHELLIGFTHDTALSMTFQAEICPNCDRLHCFLLVDYLDEDEIPNNLLN